MAGNYYENQLRINDEYLDSVLNEFFLDGVRIFFVNHNIKKERIYRSPGKYPSIQMLFVLEGTNVAMSHCTGETYRLKGNQHNLVYLPHTDMDFKIEGNKARILGIQFNETFFRNLVAEDSRILSVFWEKVLKKQETFNTYGRILTITPRIKMILSEIMNTDRKGYIKKLFLESSMLELFMCQVEQAEFYSNNPNKISKSDRDKLYTVKEFLESNILAEFTLREISLKVGLNEFKLKKGFKELFGKTVFGYFNELRMGYAKDLILLDKKNVSEVADILRYSEPHHFTKAFKKKFGILPGSLK